MSKITGFALANEENFRTAIVNNEKRMEDLKTEFLKIQADTNFLKELIQEIETIKPKGDENVATTENVQSTKE